MIASGEFAARYKPWATRAIASKTTKIFRSRV
jgi:hypothetical protein